MFGNTSIFFDNETFDDSLKLDPMFSDDAVRELGMDPDAFDTGSINQDNFMEAFTDFTAIVIQDSMKIDHFLLKRNYNILADNIHAPNALDVINDGFKDTMKKAADAIKSFFVGLVNQFTKMWNAVIAQLSKLFSSRSKYYDKKKSEFESADVSKSDAKIKIGTLDMKEYAKELSALMGKVKMMDISPKDSDRVEHYIQASTDNNMKQGYEKLEKLHKTEEVKVSDINKTSVMDVMAHKDAKALLKQLLGEHDPHRLADTAKVGVKHAELAAKEAEKGDSDEAKEQAKIQLNIAKLEKFRADNYSKIYKAGLSAAKRLSNDAWSAFNAVLSAAKAQKAKEEKDKKKDEK